MHDDIDNVHTLALTAASLVTVLTVVSLGLISRRHLKIFRSFPRQAGVSRRDYRRFLRALPEYRRTEGRIRVLTTVLGASLLVQVLLVFEEPVVRWTAASLALLYMLAAWIMDRPPGDGPKLQTR